MTWGGQAGMQSLTGNTSQPPGPVTSIVKVTGAQVGESLLLMLPSKKTCAPGAAIAPVGEVLSVGLAWVHGAAAVNCAVSLPTCGDAGGVPGFDVAIASTTFVSPTCVPAGKI